MHVGCRTIIVPAKCGTLGHFEMAKESEYIWIYGQHYVCGWELPRGMTCTAVRLLKPLPVLYAYSIPS